jgi:hypothetical protein
MARQVLVQYVDDLDGTPSNNVSTVTFGLDGAAYEIDLGDGNAAKLRDVLAPYVAVAQRVGGRRKRGGVVAGPVGSGRSKEQTQAIRDWAKKNGHDISDRGRIPAAVINAFEAAH